MNKEELFEYLGKQDQEKFLDLLRLAFDTMNTNQRHEVFGKIITEIPQPLVEGNKLQITIKEFYEKSLAGHYYAPFDINSKNFSDIPEETDAWFDEINDHLKECSKLSDRGDHEIAVQCFKLLYELIDKMENGDEIIFADEYGTWMITGNQKKFIKSYLTSLSMISTPEEYTIGAIPLIKRDSHESLSNKVYSTAIKIGNKDQKAHLKREAEEQRIRIK